MFLCLVFSPSNQTGLGFPKSSVANQQVLTLLTQFSVSCFPSPLLQLKFTNSISNFSGKNYTSRLWLEAQYLHSILSYPPYALSPNILPSTFNYFDSFKKSCSDFMYFGLKVFFFIITVQFNNLPIDNSGPFLVHSEKNSCHFERSRLLLFTLQAIICYISED